MYLSLSSELRIRHVVRQIHGATLADSAELRRLHIFLVIKIALKHAAMAETVPELKPDTGNRNGKSVQRVRTNEAKPDFAFEAAEQEHKEQQKLVNVCAMAESWSSFSSWSWSCLSARSLRVFGVIKLN